MRVLVVAEVYPSRRDPVLGIWAHRQALAARDAGADVRVVVLHRVVPPAASVRGGRWRGELGARLGEPRRQTRDGLPVTYAPYVSPPRARGYAGWSRWAAPVLRRVLRGERFDLVHAHNAIPAGDAVRRAGVDTPVVTSVHGGDVFHTAPKVRGGEAAVRAALASAHLVLANSAGIAERARTLGARDTRVVHLGTDLPEEVVAPDDPRSVVTVAHLVARKRHADVIRAVAQIGARYVVIGDGPEREALEALARETGANVEFRGQLEHADALREARRCAVFAMPSTEEAFGVAYIEAMAAGLPAIGATGEPGAEEIRTLLRVPAGDVDALARMLEGALRERERLGAAARREVEDRFTWQRCGRETVLAYADALRR